MSTMRERAAQAMAESDFPGYPYTKFHVSWKERYGRYADAAISTLSEPTEAMVMAGWDAYLKTDGTPFEKHRAAISAALTESAAHSPANTETETKP